jgi:aminomethyltransferase
MVPFAGYHMPLVYGNVGQGASLSTLPILLLFLTFCTVVASHQHVRQSAGLFDVGHMVQSK